jgi:sugar phosphate isomerase/epimerase
VITLGNAAAPRWWDLDVNRLPEYLAWVKASGAGAAELVLHHGSADERTARVHVLEPEWGSTLRALRRAALDCHVHASLDLRFAMRRAEDDLDGLLGEYRGLLAFAAEAGEGQTAPVAFVVHASDGRTEPPADGAAVCQFLIGCAEQLERLGANATVAVELRGAVGPGDRRPDRGRSRLLDLVRAVDSPRIGICWDGGHDWENRGIEEGWDADPPSEFLKRVVHVHLHDAGEDGSLHHPLIAERVPWRGQLRALARAGYTGAVTLEVRYRHAKAAGEPWQVLAESYRSARNVLDAAPPTD